MSSFANFYRLKFVSDILNTLHFLRDCPTLGRNRLNTRKRFFLDFELSIGNRYSGYAQNLLWVYPG